jgi:hypothetical protein
MHGPRAKAWWRRDRAALKKRPQLACIGCVGVMRSMFPMGETEYPMSSSSPASACVSNPVTELYGETLTLYAYFWSCLLS